MHSFSKQALKNLVNKLISAHLLLNTMQDMDTLGFIVTKHVIPHLHKTISYYCF